MKFKLWTLTFLISILQLHAQLMKCSYGERGSLTATCVNATSGFFRTTSYRFDSLDETLRCSNCHLGIIEPNTFDISGNHILTLDLQNSNISTIRDSSFVGLVYLENLYLQNNNIPGLFSGIFRGIKKLEVLRIDNNSIFTLSGYSFKELVNLKKLNLESNSLKSIDPNAFSGLNALQSLDLGNNKIKDLDDTFFKALPNILEINLSNNIIDDLVPLDIQNCTLVSLNLANNKIKSLKQNSFSYMFNLKSLTLTSNEIQNIDPSAFNGLHNLEVLNLAYNAISVINKGSFIGLPDLTDLSLEFNSLQTFKTGLFVGLPEMKYLNLSNNKIALFERTGVLPLHSLSTLDLSYNNLTDIDYKVLYHYMPKISYMNLDHNRWPCYLIEEIDDYFRNDDIKLSADSILTNTSCIQITRKENKAEVGKIVAELEPSNSYASAYVVYPVMALMFILIAAIGFLLFRMNIYKYPSHSDGFQSRVNLVSSDLNHGDPDY